MGKSTISMAIFNSKLLVYQRVMAKSTMNHHLVGGWPITLWKIWKSVGSIIPNIWKVIRIYSSLSVNIYKFHEFTHLFVSPHESSGLEGLEHLGAAKERHIPARHGTWTLSMKKWWDMGMGQYSIPINTIFRGMTIHLPAILMFTRGTRFWPIPISTCIN